MRPFALSMSMAVLLAAPFALAGEQEKKPTPSKKVYTEDDLRRARGAVSVGTPSEASASAETTGASAKPAEGEATPAAEPTESEKREALKADLQAQMDDEARKAHVLTERRDQAQRELNDLSNLAFSQPDSPSGRRAALMKFVEDAEREIKQAQEKMDQIEEQARRAGVSISRE